MNQFIVPPGQTILDAGFAARAPIKFSCTMRGCAECRLRLVDGEVGMEEPESPTDAERDTGLILTCVGWPFGPVTLEAE